MGNPVHYSLELPQRCLQLVDELWPHAEKVLQKDRPDLGALTTTFLISMSMPIVNLPIERIERNLRTESDGYADDRHIDPAISKAVEQVLGGQEFRSAPFYVPDAWSFANCTHEELFNIAGGIPDRLTTELGTGEAVASAGKLPTSQWCSILRNAMAHGESYI